MSLADTLMTLVLLGSLLFVLGMLVRLAVLALRGRWAGVRGSATALGGFIAVYALALIAVALVVPRRSLGAGSRECFDDWCVAGVAVEEAPEGDAACASGAGTRTWLATLEVSSDAKRVRQRARDAVALLEDGAGGRHAPCGPPLRTHALTDALDPGEAFRVVEPFALPSSAVPVGLVVRHGAFPGALIIGDDQSLLHAPTLLGVAVHDR